MAPVQIRDYELVERLGSGAFGAVWLARDAARGQEVAVKLLHAKWESATDAAGGPSPAERFIRESRLLMQLDHPGLVKVRAVIDERPSGPIACVMERIKGQDLGALLGALDLPLLVEIFARVAEALAYVHQRGVVHRDVKLANIVVSDPDPRTGERLVKLIDFGIAKELEAVLPRETAVGSFLGTLGMTSPECFRRLDGEPIELTPREDQWSLGVTLFHALTGSLPFAATSLMQLREQVLGKRVPPIRLLPTLGLGACPPALERVVKRMLEKDPERRFEDMRAVAAELHGIAGELQGPGEARSFAERLTRVGPAPAREADTFRSPSLLPDIDVEDPESALATMRNPHFSAETQRMPARAGEDDPMPARRAGPRDATVPEVPAPPPPPRKSAPAPEPPLAPAGITLSSALMWVGAAAALAFAIGLLVGALGR